MGTRGHCTLMLLQSLHPTAQPFHPVLCDCHVLLPSIQWSPLLGREYSVCQSLSHVQLFSTLWTIAHRLFCPRDSPGKNTGVGCHALHPEIFPNQGSNLGLLHCRQILYCLRYRGSTGVQKHIFNKNIWKYVFNINMFENTYSVWVSENMYSMWRYMKIHIQEILQILIVKICNLISSGRGRWR